MQSVEPLGNRTVDREARAPKRCPTWPSEQPVANKVENLELFTHLAPESLIDCTLGLFEQLGVPVRTIVESDGWNPAEDVVRPESISEIWRQTLPLWVVAATLLGSIGADEDALDRAGEAVVVTQYEILHQRSERVVFNGSAQRDTCVHREIPDWMPEAESR